MDPITLFLVNLIIGVALSAASTLAQQAFAPRPKAPGYRATLQTGGKVPQSAILGTVAVAGKLAYANTWGSSGDTQNAHLTQVISFGVLPISGLSAVYVNSQKGPVSGTGHVAQGYPIQIVRKKGKDYLWAEFFNGSQTTANSFLTSKFGADAARPWLSTMVGRGVPYITLDTLYDPKVWNGVPSYMVELQGIPLYDPRKDSTAGGSGTQRLSDQSTWAFSDNPAVMIYNILVGLRYANVVVWGGRATQAQLPFAVWAAGMDACDASVSLKDGGNEKRFRAGLEVSFDRRPTDVIRDLLVASNSRISEHAGVYNILVGVPSTADGSFTDADLIVSQPTPLTPFPNLDEIINGATATYLEPAQAWESKETAPYYNSALEAADDGRRQTEGLSLDCVFSGTQAQRIIKAVVEESRRFRKHVVVLPPQFTVYRPLHLLAWTSVRNGYASKLFLITAKTIAPNGNVVFALQEVDAADHNWTPATDEKTVTFAPLTPIAPPPQVTSGFAAVPYTVQDQTSADRRAGIEVFWDAGLADVRAVRVQVRKHWGDKNVVSDATFDYDVDELSPSRVVANPAILAASPYEVRGIYLPYSGREVHWSNQDVDGTDGPWWNVTTPEVPEADIPPIEVTMLGNELAATHGYVTGTSAASISAQFAQAEEDREAAALAFLDANATARERIDIVTVQKDAAVAGVIEVRQAVVDTNAAMASLETQVIAAIGENLADGYVSMTAEVNEAASTSTVLIGAKATKGVTAQAALAIKAQVDGLGGTISQVGALGNFYVFNYVGGVLTAIPAFSVENGQVKFMGARAGKITSSNGTSMIVNFDSPEIYMD